MQNSHFDAYLKQMRTYIKTLRLVFNGHANWTVLDALPGNYHVIANHVRALIDREYQTLSDREWQERIIYYKQSQDQYDSDHRQEGNEYLEAFWKKERAIKKEFIQRQEEVQTKLDTNQWEVDLENYKQNYLRFKARFEDHKKLFKQNQSYFDALRRTRRHIDSWIEKTLDQEEKVKLLKEQKVSPKSQKKSAEELPIQGLYINPSSKEALFSGLCNYIDEAEHETLKDLIYGKKVPTNKIVVTGLVKELGLTFFQSGSVINRKAKLLSKQISKFFIIKDEEKLVEFNQDYLVKQLRGPGNK